MTVPGEVERCIDTEYGRLVRAVAVIAGSTGDAEEAVQEAFARAWERERRGQTFDHLAGWVATVALNHVRSRFRRSTSERRALDRLAAAPTPAQEPEPDIALIVRSAIDGLARRQRDAVVLYYLLDVDIATTARLLDVSEGTVKSALARARSTLAELLRSRELEA
jgi:RNA polymerase sigma-70 factor (ECF subfamily)